ncbi:hypothetical protein, partial [Bacillus sp. S1-R5C1-FB]|uniref:hypothetical protein n=1 Tax=Bacillus sp. S1-R5C1-FB TaxID=1973491 RepID=UPI001C4EF951
MSEELLSHYDDMTGVDMPGEPTEAPKLYTGETLQDRQMVFQLEPMDLASVDVLALIHICSSRHTPCLTTLYS